MLEKNALQRSQSSRIWKRRARTIDSSTHREITRVVFTTAISYEYVLILDYEKNKLI